MKVVTILFLRKDNQLLLAMKKRGFGQGKWNGAGGKAEPGETSIEAAIRETKEEIGVTPADPELVGIIKFYEKTDPSFGHHAHIFVADKWKGEPVESDEMRPQWFAYDDIPYDDMWDADRLWLPHVLNNQLFEGVITSNNWQIGDGDSTIKQVQRLKD